MKLRYFVTPFLLIIAAASACLLGMYLLKVFSAKELEQLCSSLQAIVFIFSASVGLLALIQYWGASEAEIKHKRWEKLKHLEATFREFRSRHKDIIIAFEWRHILKEEYLPLCEKAVVYDNSDDDGELSSLITYDEILKIRKLDDFLEFFENYYFSISKKLISVENFLIYMQYNVILLGDFYFNEEDPRFRNYVDCYYFNIEELLLIFEKHLLKTGTSMDFAPNYPRVNKA